MKTAYIFHDAFSDQYADWYPWMKTTLEGFGYTVFVPSFPTPAAQSYESWKAVIKNYIPTFDEETILVGHGTGGTFALRLTEESAKQIHGLFLVASYAEKINHVGYNNVNETFINHDFNWETIKKNTMVTAVFAGAGDPFVSEDVSQKLAEGLGVHLQIIPEGGHINKASGFIQAVAVAQIIQESLGALNTNISTSETADAITKIQQPAGTVVGLEFDEKNTIPNSPLPIPGIPEVPSAVPTPEIKPTTNAHTMYQDMSHLVNSNQGTVASSLLTKARTDEAVKKATSPTNPKNIFYTIGSIALIIGAIMILGLVAQRYMTAPKNMGALQIPSLISADTHQKIDVSQKLSYAIAESIRSLLDNPINKNTISDIYYVNKNSRINFPQVLQSLDITTLPPKLAAEFGADPSGSRPLFMHGIGSSGNRTAHFLVLPLAHYDSTFAAMREWEPYILGDVGIFMNIPESFLKTYITRNDFKDELVTNRTVRVMRYKKPATITLDEPVVAVPTTPTPEALPLPEGSAETVTSGEESTETNFISEGLRTITTINPFTVATSPYQENDIMLAYFFLNDHTLIILDDLTIIPEILKRHANSQIYQ